MNNTCPACKSTNTQDASIRENNGIYGPGAASWVVEEKSLCNDCGVYFKPMDRSKEPAVEYVCGFYFDHTFQQVVLIWKNKPAWQKGKLNGVGGKIEKGELPITAMRREFYEETGILHNEWIDLIVLSGEGWKVYFFCTIGRVNEFEYVETKEEEEVAKIEVNRLLAYDYDHIPNLDWLVPMGIYKLENPNERMTFCNQQKQKDGTE